MASSTRSHDKVRRITAFFLFIFLVLSSITITAKREIVSAKKIVSYFTSVEFVSGVRQNVIDYADDMLIQGGESDRAMLERVISYDIVEQIVTGYYDFLLRSKDGYSQQVEFQAVEQLRINLKNEVKAELDKKGIDYTQANLDEFIDKVSSFATDEIELHGSDKIKTVLNLLSIVINVVMAASLVVSVLLGVVLFFIGKTRYRSIRAISISLISAGLYDILLALMIKIISVARSVDIFPIYLKNAFMDYVNNGIFSIAIAGCLLLVISILVSTVVWKLKRKEL